MPSLHSYAAIFVAASTASAVRIPWKHVKRAGTSSFGVSKPQVLAATADNSLSLSSHQDLLYMANITIAETEYVMQLDTGSSDLWVQGPTKNAEQTTLTRNISYASGWAYGNIAYAKVSFAGIEIPKQAFVDATEVENHALTYGAQGIVGLGFTSLSNIDLTLNSTSSSEGRSLLYNMFEDDPTQPNFISFALQRSTQEDDDVEGSFTIGEYEPEYEAVKNQPPISTFPVHAPKRWNVLLEAVHIGNQVIVPKTNVSTAPSNRAVALLDSGTSYTYVPTEIADAIYGNITGAQFNPTYGQWVVPCEVEIDMALQFGGQVFPMHPLDVTPRAEGSKTLCLGSFVPSSFAVGANQFDWLVGVNFLRSSYSIYDFGDFDSAGKMGDPYVKLLSLTNPDEASAEFVKQRGGTARKGITYQPHNSTAAPSALNMDETTQILSKVDTISTLFPIVLALLALNAFVVIAAVVGGGCYFYRRRRAGTVVGAVPRPIPGRMTPMAIDTSRANSALGQNATNMDPHVYERVHNGEEDIPMRPPKGFYNGQPVSMALTEDTLFAPPSPAYKSFKGEKADRPMSTASMA